MFDFWPVYSGERFRASWPSCLTGGIPDLQVANLLLTLLISTPEIVIVYKHLGKGNHGSSFGLGSV